MKDLPSKGVVNNTWSQLRRFTNARIGLGRAGKSLPTKEWLAFQMDHANARDAVHIPLNTTELQKQLQPLTSNSLTDDQQDIFLLHSQASDRATYLQRPDLGRRLSKNSSAQLTHYRDNHGPCKGKIAIVIVDGLSSTAIQTHAATMAQILCANLKRKAFEWAPICIVSQGRVAIGDEVGELLDADSLILIIGERPGLSSPDSLGIYYTLRPKMGLQDANRNCISNIRPAGLSFQDASDKLVWLLEQSIAIQASGVMLKDQSDHNENTLSVDQGHNFLTNKSKTLL